MFICCNQEMCSCSTRAAIARGTIPPIAHHKDWCFGIVLTDGIRPHAKPAIASATIHYNWRSELDVVNNQPERCMPISVCSECYARLAKFLEDVNHPHTGYSINQPY